LQSTNRVLNQYNNSVLLLSVPVYVLWEALCKFISVDWVVGHNAQSYCSLGSDTRHSGEVIGGEGCCVLAPDWSTS